MSIWPLSSGSPSWLKQWRLFRHETSIICFDLLFHDVTKGKKTCLEGSVNFVLYIKFWPVRFPRSLDSFASQVNLLKNFIRVSRFLSCNWLSSLHDLSHEDFPNFLDLIYARSSLVTALITLFFLANLNISVILTCFLPRDFFFVLCVNSHGGFRF